MSKEHQQLMATVTAPGVGDPSVDIRVEWHKVGGGWDPVILHWHNYCEFEFILTGCGTHTLNNIPLPVHRGSAYICMMEDFHKIKNAPGETMVVANLKFSESLVQEPLLKKLYEISNHRYCDFPKEDVNQLVMLFQILENVQNQPPKDPEVKKILLTCTLNQIIALFLFHYSLEENENDAQKEQNRMQKAISYIHRNFTKDLSQTEVAEQAGLSVNYFSTTFKNQMQCSYSEYLLNLKLNYARNLIVSERLTNIHMVASKVGFSSTSYFIKVFKKKFGVTPKKILAQ